MILLTAALLLAPVFMTGCTRLSEAPNTAPSGPDTPTVSDGSDVHDEPKHDDAPADTPPFLTLPILDEIETSVTAEGSDPSASAVPTAVKLLDWGVNTGLDTEEIGDAASEWLDTKDGEANDLLNKLKLVDDAYQKLLTAEARELLDGAGREEVEITWGSDPVEPVEAIMQAAGLRG
mgnify:FL=1